MVHNVKNIGDHLSASRTGQNARILQFLCMKKSAGVKQLRFFPFREQHITLQSYKIL